MIPQAVMMLDDPLDYELKLAAGTYRVLQKGAECKFSRPTSTPGIAKLYTVSDKCSLIYVGITQQRMSDRLRYGFTADGRNGYHGYKWKDLEKTLRLSVWTAKADDTFVSLRVLETVEAEVAYLCRLHQGQWPAHQHEIHFYASCERYRKAAECIFGHAVRYEASE